jgi:hypothetical protein
MNALGQKIFSSSESNSNSGFSSMKKQIDLHNIAHGVYFLEINTGNNFIRKKILID